MAYFKRKQFKIEAQQVTAETINDVYAWVNASGKGTASALTEDTFLLDNGSRLVPVKLGSWVVNYHSGAVQLVVILDSDFHERFEPLASGEESMPYIYGTNVPS